MTQKARPPADPSAYGRDRIAEEASRLAGETVFTLHRDGWAFMEGPLTERLGLGGGICLLDIDDWHGRQHPEDVPRCDAALAALAPGRPMAVEYRIRDANNEYVWIFSRGGVVEADADGNWIRMSGIVSDISRRKNLESQLHANEALVREALISGKGGVWSLDLATMSGQVAGVATSITGLDSGTGTITLEQWRQAIHPDDRALSFESFEHMMSGEVSEVEYRMLGRDGDWFWVRNTGRVVETGCDGQPRRMAGLLANISERKALERRVEQVNFHLAEALKAADLAAWRYDLVKHVATIRGDLAARLGVDQDNPVIPGPEWMDHVHPDDKGDVIRKTLAVAEGKANSFEALYRAQDRSGEWRWIRSTGRVVDRSPGGTALIAAGVLKDETRQIALETALAAERDRFRATYAETPAMMHSIDREGRLVNVSDYWLAQMGYAREEVIGMPASHFLVDEDRERARLKIQPDFWRDGAVADVPYRFRTKSGAIIDILLSAVTENDASGEPVLAHAVLVDVTERNALHRALVEEKDRFEAIYRATPAMMHTIDASGAIIQVSDYWLSVMGYDRDEVIGRKSTDFLDAESRLQAERQNLPDLFRYGKNNDVQYRFVKKSGQTIDTLLNSFLERDGEGNPMASYAVITDISALRRAYDGLKRSNRELDRFAAVASHDLQEPLRKVAAFASLMRRRYADQLDEEGRRCLDFMNDGAQRMQLLIDDLLSYSRLGNKPLRTETFDLGEAVHDAIRRLDVQIEESGARIEIESTGLIEADRPVLTQMMQNLISNAVKYRGVRPPLVRIGLSESADGWKVFVSDNGIGFDPRFAEKIFAPFQRLHSREAYPGTGIGLSIVQQGIERHGGHVEVESVPGEGSTFLLHLPRRIDGLSALTA
ncbi:MULTISPECIES: PAS domain-containing protein [Hyphobacterium]|uniref:histidine kinase n=1 Tax=Hyphobacterium vulgare TaxID=1736751 RepID=A0ABV6ZW58_9PROT